jgi:hypothetical protein
MPTVRAMTKTNVHLEDVIRAARQGLALALAVALLGLAALLVVGLSLAIALVGAAALGGVGVTSGGFGLVARIAMRHPRHRGPAGAVSVGERVAPLRVPQTR